MIVYLTQLIVLAEGNWPAGALDGMKKFKLKTKKKSIFTCVATVQTKSVPARLPTGGGQLAMAAPLPSEMPPKLFRLVALLFAKLLLLHGKGLSGSLGEKKFKVFNDLEITPVFLNRQTMTLDYFENKKLYFIRKVDGTVVGVL